MSKNTTIQMNETGANIPDRVDAVTESSLSIYQYLASQLVSSDGLPESIARNDGPTLHANMRDAAMAVRNWAPATLCLSRIPKVCYRRFRPVRGSKLRSRRLHVARKIRKESQNGGLRPKEWLAFKVGFV